MATISPPKISRFHSERFEYCQRALDDAVRELIDEAGAAGWEPDEIFAAIAAIADAEMLSLDANDVILQLRRHLAE